MSNKLYEESDVQAIANAIRTKNGSSDTYMVSEMAQAVLDIPTGTTPTGTKQITISSAGTTTENVSAYANAEITVPQGQYKPNIDATPTNPSISVSNSGLITAEVMTQYVNDLLKPSFTEGYIKSSDVSMKVKIGGSATQQLNTVNGQTVTPTTSTQYIAVQGDYVLGAINVGPIPSQYIIPTGTKSISANGTGIDVTQYASVDVNVSGGQTYTHLLEYVEVTPTTNATSTNPLQIQLQSGYMNAIVLIFSLDSATVKHSTIYKALYAIRGYFNGSVSQNVTAILRPAGTVGTDSNMMTFNPTTGVMTLGGQYGTFMAGSTYGIYHWEMGTIS